MEAKLKAFARHTEQGTKHQQSDSKIQVFHYHLPNEGLVTIWNRIVQTLNQPGLADLGGPILLLDAKNLKTIFRSPSPSVVVQKFLKTW